ncbi:DNA-directed RNA polymerase subunit beta' [Candidatus Peregrinibacteria bacterium]|nr:MAG: DNA-directed RNA polymerase subunit beta' [Candidatus Peregrinibacteria bacterium]
MAHQKTKKHDEFNSITLSIASPEEILSWSHGEVTKPETINYRTQKPERDGLFCEKIFGPTKNWECYCGKYKRVRYKGVVCEKCGVEVTRSIVRRERMGHISLAVPVTHIWFLRSMPSRIGLLLDLPIKAIEQVIYFAAYVVIHVDEDAKQEAMEQLEKDYQTYKKQIQEEFKQKETEFKVSKRGKKTANEGDTDADVAVEDLVKVENQFAQKVEDLNLQHNQAKEELENLSIGRVIGEIEYRELSMKFGHIFRAGTGAESIREILSLIQLGDYIKQLEEEYVKSTGQRQKKLSKRIRFASALQKAGIKPEWMVIKELPVIPPDLRPMVQLDGGRFAASDLNDLYRRVINRNNRLKRLIAIGAPEVISRNEKRMLQEAVDVLFNNQPRGGKSAFTSGDKRKYRSLSDMLKGKQGRFRQNLLGKRVDYSGRSVIVVGPNLKLHQCGLPKEMALKLFKPFVIGQLIRQELAHNVKGAERLIEMGKKMLASRNLLKPSAGEPIVTPSQDMVLGIYYLTKTIEKKEGEGMAFGTIEEAINAYRMGYVDLHALIKARVNSEQGTEIIDTTVGRLIFNTFVPKQLGFINETVGKNQLHDILAKSLELIGPEVTATFADDLKRIGFKFATKSGLSIAVSDMIEAGKRDELVAAADEKVKRINNQYWKGWITQEERYNHAIRTWSSLKGEITNNMIEEFKKTPENHIYYMIDSGARGNWGQITQLCGMKGLVANPGGKTIELPIKSNLKNGFSILEYFIATHGGRKGKSDTALKTAEAGYLTRRLVDAVQDVIVVDDEPDASHKVTRAQSEYVGIKFSDRIYGRILAAPILDPKNQKVLVEKDAEINKEVLDIIEDRQIGEVVIYSIMSSTREGIVAKSYGRDLGTNKQVEIGTAVGIIAAQSIGEPGTQLTMRTFHMGGVAEGSDITQGLTRVEELFEARTPRSPAMLSEISGRVQIKHKKDQIELTVSGEDVETDTYHVPPSYEVQVKKGEKVKAKQVLAKSTVDKNTVKVLIEGEVTKISGNQIEIKHLEKQVKTYTFGHREHFQVANGDLVAKGSPLNRGHLNLQELIQLTDVETVQRYIMNEVQRIYASQGQTINDKHIEIIVKQMFSKVRIIHPGDTPFLAGEIVTVSAFELANKELENKANKEPATGERLLLGISRVAIMTNSWLSAASFQETIRVLVEAATTKMVDNLRGLKENVIIGKLIPAGKIYQKMMSKEGK